MEKEHFLDLAKNYTSLTVEEALAIDELQQTYPYSQVIHCLATRGAQDHHLEKSTALLGLSAVYSTDRSVLKNIMTAPRVERGNEMPVEVLPEPSRVEEVVHQLDVQPGLSGDALNEEIMLDLNRLQQLKQEFESSFVEFSKVKVNGPRQAVVGIKAQVEPAIQKKEAPTRPPKKTKTDELIPEPSGDALLQEIASTRKRVVPGSEKQKEQIQIIDQFISKQPSISKNPSPAADGQDLAEKSGDLIDSMVSETLVEILLRQGKKDKAIEVLRKLIWKFPQKKAIFAAQIDDLKK